MEAVRVIAPAGITDVAAWTGPYPFRYLAACDVDALRTMMRRRNIRHTVVSHFDCLFQEDSLAAYERSTEELGGFDGMNVWPVVNPTRPGAISRLETCLDAFPARGLRLLPNYHGCQLSDPCVSDLMKFAHEKKLIVQIFARIADERWHWMLKVPPVADPDLAEFATRFPRSVMIYSGLNRPQVLSEAMAGNPRCYADLSGLHGPQFAVEKVVATLPPAQLLFGSLWPIQTLEAILWQIQLAGIPEVIRQDILIHNAIRAGIVDGPPASQSY